jgi:hypothetical protein
MDRSCDSSIDSAASDPRVRPEKVSVYVSVYDSRRCVDSRQEELGMAGGARITDWHLPSSAQADKFQIIWDSKGYSKTDVFISTSLLVRAFDEGCESFAADVRSDPALRENVYWREAELLAPS